jgi:hypothetical protein
MKISKRDGSKERLILISMITDKSVLGSISGKWERGLFSAKWCDLVASWCIKYFNKYGEAPNQSIEGLFESWASNGKADESTVKLVEKFLNSLSDEYESETRKSSDYIIDLAGAHFNEVKLKSLARKIEGAVDNGELEEALAELTKFNRVDMGVGAGIDAFRDKDAMRKAFESANERLIEYPDDLGLFFQNIFERDGFVAFQAPEKRGKSFVLLDVAWNAALQRRKVAYFEAGDNSQNQVMRRFLTRATKHPFRLRTGFPGEVLIPTSISREPDSEIADVEHSIKTYDRPLSWGRGFKACKKLLRSKIKSDDAMFRIDAHPNSTLSVHKIKSILDAWERDGWIPDVIVIDYADILAAPAGFAETRDQINATWKQLRALSQQLHCLVVTATQADADSYRVHTQTKRNFSEDKRKHSHVTAMVAINQTIEEKQKGIMRLNFLDLRDGEYQEMHCIHVAGCLALANPFMKAAF